MHRHRETVAGLGATCNRPRCLPAKILGFDIAGNLIAVFVLIGNHGTCDEFFLGQFTFRLGHDEGNLVILHFSEGKLFWGEEGNDVVVVAFPPSRLLGSDNS